MLEWVSLDSTAIIAIAYRQKILYIRFQTDTIYQYLNVPKYVFINFLQADSAGQYFNQQIKDKYYYRRLI